MKRESQLARCDAEADYFRHIVMTGELSPYCDSTQPGAAIADCIGALVALADWEIERELIAALAAKGAVSA